MEEVSETETDRQVDRGGAAVCVCIYINIKEYTSLVSGLAAHVALSLSRPAALTSRASFFVPGSKSAKMEGKKNLLSPFLICFRNPSYLFYCNWICCFLFTVDWFRFVDIYLVSSHFYSFHDDFIYILFFNR